MADSSKVVLPVLSFFIRGYKNERDGQAIALVSSDDTFQNIEISQTITALLERHSLTAADIISVTANTAYGNANGRDPGSWDFWMFCRNPAFGTGTGK